MSCWGRGCRAVSCWGRGCRAVSCRGRGCWGRGRRAVSCRGHGCWGRGWRAVSCRGHGCWGRGCRAVSCGHRLTVGRWLASAKVLTSARRLTRARRPTYARWLTRPRRLTRARWLTRPGRLTRARRPTCARRLTCGGVPAKTGTAIRPRRRGRIGQRPHNREVGDAVRILAEQDPRAIGCFRWRHQHQFGCTQISGIASTRSANTRVGGKPDQGLSVLDDQNASAGIRPRLRDPLRVVSAVGDPVQCATGKRKAPEGHRAVVPAHQANHHVSLAHAAHQADALTPPTMPNH